MFTGRDLVAAHGCHMQKTSFPGTCWVHGRTCVFGPFLRAGCAGAACVHGGSLGSGVGAGGRCLAPLVDGVRWSAPLHLRGSVGEAYGLSHGGPGDTVSSRCAGSGMRGLGLVCHLVALSGLLLRWPSRAFGCCCVGGGWAAEMFLTMRTIRVDRS